MNVTRVKGRWSHMPKRETIVNEAVIAMTFQKYINGVTMMVQNCEITATREELQAALDFIDEESAKA